MAPAQRSPVTPDVLLWAIGEDGRPYADLADKLEIDPDVLRDWTTGDAQPSKGQVTELAKLLKRPRALFFLPTPPTAATLPPSFRHPPGDSSEISLTARRKVRQARRVQHAVAWALRDEPPVDVPWALMRDDARQAARGAREWLGVTDDQQARWVDEYAALNAWRAALDALGVLVFVLEIGRDEVRGFSAWDDRAPLIVANSSSVSAAARSFTLAHELAHLVLRADAACIEPRSGGLPDAELERWCEAFGAELLMPEAAVQTWASARRLAAGGADIDDVRGMMNRFRVSARAAALRLIAAGYATPALYARVEGVFRPKPPPEPDSASPSTFRRPRRSITRPREFGGRTIATVLDGLPTRDALAILNVTVDDVREMAETVPGVVGF